MWKLHIVLVLQVDLNTPRPQSEVFWVLPFQLFLELKTLAAFTILQCVHVQWEWTCSTVMMSGNVQVRSLKTVVSIIIVIIKTTSGGWCIFHVLCQVFFPSLWHSSHVEGVSVDVWYGPLRSETDRQPLWGKTRRRSRLVWQKKVCGFFLPLPVIHGPAWEIQGSTPACRPCRWGST